MLSRDHDSREEGGGNRQIVEVYWCRVYFGSSGRDRLLSAGEGIAPRALSDRSVM